MLRGHTVQLLSRLLCCAHYRHEEGLSIHLPTSTPILYAHLSSSHLALHHLTRLQLFVSPFHPRSLSRPHLSASASSLPLTFSHLPHLSFVHLVPSISCSPWLFPSLSDVSVASFFTVAHVHLQIMGNTRLCHKWPACTTSHFRCVSSPQISDCADSGWSNIKWSTQLFQYLDFRLTCGFLFLFLKITLMSFSARTPVKTREPC